MTLSLFPPKVTAADILIALRTRHPAKEWIYVEEVRAGTGHDYANQWDNQTRKFVGGRGEKAIAQRLDAWALQMWSPGAIVAYEVKVSRGDFLREISPIHRADRIRAPLMVIHGALPQLSFGPLSTRITG